MFCSYILSVMYCALKVVPFFILTLKCIVVTEYNRSIYPIYRYILHATYMFPWNSVTVNHTQNASMFELSVQRFWKLQLIFENLNVPFFQQTDECTGFLCKNCENLNKKELWDFRWKIKFKFKSHFYLWLTFPKN